MPTRLPVLAVGLLLVVACGESRQAAGPTPSPPAVTLTLTAGGCELVGPSLLHAGPILVHLRNQTGDRLWVGLTPIAAGHTYAEFSAYLDQERARQTAGKPSLGPPDWAMPTLTTGPSPLSGAG